MQICRYFINDLNIRNSVFYGILFQNGEISCKILHKRLFSTFSLYSSSYIPEKIQYMVKLCRKYTPCKMKEVYLGSNNYNQVFHKYGGLVSYLKGSRLQGICFFLMGLS